MANLTQYLRRNTAANYLKETYGFGSQATLAKLATIGGGPIYRVAGRIPLYLTEDLDTWARARISAPRRSTSSKE